MKLFIQILICFSVGIGFAQKKSITALNVDNGITLDGVLDEAQWQNAQMVEGFTQIEPDAGAPSAKNTTVRVLYDDNAIYFGAYCYEDEACTSKVLCQRDDYNANIDYFSVMIDTYNDQQNGFVFSVSTMGVQYDAKIYAGDYNSKLDMIWFGEVAHHDNGWSVEMKIPYSAIRFANKPEQIWGINFTRYRSVNREEASWNMVRPDLNNVVTQAGQLLGIKDIKPPVRLFFLPYVSGYAQHFPSTGQNLAYDVNGGMDIKYGINEAFTLDMTLVPDFGQVVSDNVVLNLTPFEVQFPENRPFFTEGTELFEKAGLFYSRRVGVQPVNQEMGEVSLSENEEIIFNPTVSNLYNATKFSGRTEKGLGVGVFNAVSAPQNTVIVNTATEEQRQVETSPLTNYNVLVFDQNLKNNSYITLTNTNVMRAGPTYDANVTGLNSQVNTADNSYFAAGNVAVSQKYFSDSIGLGHNFGISSGKQKGNFTFSGAYSEMSDTYDPNDLGFLLVNNNRSVNANVGYNIYKPFGIFNRFWSGLNINYNRLYAPDVYTGTYYSLNAGAALRTFHAFGFNMEGNIGNTFDYFEPRTPGYYFKLPRYIAPGVWFSSNYQKPFALDINFNLAFSDSEWDWWDLSYAVSPRFRLSDKTFLVYRFEQALNYNQYGYAIPFAGNPEPTNDVIFGKRDVQTTTNTIDLAYTMTNKMGITFRLRHYWSKLKYNDFFALQTDGELESSTVSGVDASGKPIYDNNFNAFTIDMVYRWVFSPASEVNIAWKNNIFTSNSNVDLRYFNNLNGTLTADQFNSISIRVVYFLDYQVVKKAFSKKR